MAKRAIADYLGQPLARLSVEEREFIDTTLAKTLNKKEVIEQMRQYFRSGSRSHAH
jgi:hypothetical protein